MSGSWPYFDNERWGGPGGGRIPQEQFPATFTVFNTQVASGAADVIAYSRQLNIAIFTSVSDTGGNNATLATPGANDVGKILIMVNTVTTQNVVKTASGKILNGAAAGSTLTAPATAGATMILVASNGYWNTVVGGTGTWVLS